MQRQNMFKGIFWAVLNLMLGNVDAKYEFYHERTHNDICRNQNDAYT